MMWRYGDGMGFGGYALMALGTLAFLALVVVIAIALFRGGGTPMAAGRSAESVLADRLARGEIDEAEYRSRLDALREGSA